MRFRRRESKSDPLEAARLDREGGRVFRMVSESIVCLALAVIVFRTFEIEGYMISTGSMAPNLLGHHKRVTCPGCGWHFAVGVQYDESVAAVLTDVNSNVEPSFDPQRTSCPNCGQLSIDLSRVPRNQGDQLLVAKCAYEFQPPRRWDVAVFRNPFKPTQAYVKRVVGLPGEAIQVIRGDLYADGKIQRKDLAAQRAIRIPIFDQSFEPPETAVDWEPRWVVTGEKTHWASDGAAFEFRAPAHHDEMLWLTYRHWIRAGGSHLTTVLLPEGVPEPELSTSPFVLIRHEPKSRTLTCSGAMPVEWRDELLSKNSDRGVRTAIVQLYEESHVAAVMDDYGYNRLAAGMSAVPVRDIQMSAELSVTRKEGLACLEMTDGVQRFTLELDISKGECRLLEESREDPVRTAPLPSEFFDRPVQLEMSLFDRQVLVAIDGVPAFEPWLLTEESDEAEGAAATPARRPVRWGAKGAELRLDHLILYRDVHYTRGKARNGVFAPYQLDPDSYFMLGDNSPVSADSRSWADGGVNRRLLLGKPLVVHLPSRPGQFKVGGRMLQIRVPDFSRMRYIH